MPLHFSDEEINLLLTLSEATTDGGRHEFLRAVANELASCELAACEQPSVGTGSGWCIASREVQRRYSLAPLPGTGKHAWPPRVQSNPQCAFQQPVEYQTAKEKSDGSSR